MFHWVARSQRPVKWPIFLTFSYMYRTEKQDTRVQPPKVFQHPSNSFVSTVKLSILWRWERVCACVSNLFFPECIWVNQKIWLVSIATSKWLFWAVIWKIALDILCCPGKTCNRLQGVAHHLIERHFTCTHTNHYSSLFLWTVLLTLDRSNHVPFFSFFCLIWPGNVSPKSMYKIIWKWLIYKTMYKTV